MFLVLSLTQWAPWIATELLASPALGWPLGILVFGLALAAAARLSPRTPLLTALGRGRADLAVGGAVIGLAVYAVLFAARVLLAGSEARPAPLTTAGLTLTAGLAVSFYQAFSEEVVFRWALLDALPRRLGAPAAVLVSALVFVLFHVPKLPALLGEPYAVHLLLAGLAFGVAYLRTGSLRLGIALHLGWNFGAWMLREAPDPLVRLTAPLPSGWAEPASWLPVLGNAVLLLVALSWPIRRESASDPARKPVGARMVP